MRPLFFPGGDIGSLAVQLAKAWGLTAEELERYELLMRGPRGAFSVANISPIEVLGIHAETPAERQHYADRFVRLLYEDTERVHAFERATQAAWQRLGKPMFDPARVPGASAPLSSTMCRRNVSPAVTADLFCGTATGMAST